MEKRGGSKWLRSILSLGLLAGIFWVIPMHSAFACHAFRFESATYTVAENAPSVAIVVRRDRDGHQPQDVQDGTSSVKVSTTDQSAESGQDYTEFNRAVSFGPTETSKRVDIALKDDPAYEGSENFEVKLSTDPGSPMECTLNYGGFRPDTNPTVVTIQDNDPQTAGTSPAPGSQPGSKPPAAAPGSTASTTKAPGAALAPSPTEEAIGANVSGDIKKQKDGGPPIGTILLIAGIVLVVAGAIGGYYYLGTRD